MDNNMRGALWGNKNKKSDKHPDFTGNFTMDGKEYRVAAWKRKEGASPNAPALSFVVELPDEGDVNDEIPF